MDTPQPPAPEAPRPLTLLELLLPAGRADRALVLGSACPPRLRPAASAGEGDEEPVDLVLFAPTEAECRRPDWLARVAATCGRRLAADGLVYVLVGRRWRHRTRALLRARGLRIESAMLHLPDVAESRQLVPLEPAAARHAFARIVPLIPWKRAAARALLALRGAPVIASMRADVALVARRAGARPLFDWLPLPGVADGERRSVVVSSSWRPGSTSVVLHPVAAGAEPPVVAKLSLDPEAEPADEGSRLARLGPLARHAGAAVPAPFDGAHLYGAPVLLETRVDGEILAPLLVRRPAQLGQALARVCAWLEAWQRLTATSMRLTTGQLEREVIAHAELLAPELSGGADYLAALASRCSAAAGALAPLAASHNDLTMWNVLLDRRGTLGIVDWEAAQEATLPLKDFFYAVADAVAATQRYSDRPGAVRECFAPGGRHAGGVSRLQRSLAEAVGASPDLVELCFHACWLGHAANERRSAGPFGPTPFRDIVQWLALRETVGESGRSAAV